MVTQEDSEPNMYCPVLGSYDIIAFEQTVL